MYICSACGCCSKAGEPRQTYLFYRVVPNPVTGGTRQEIDKELPVCSSCKFDLDNGVAISDLMVIKQRSNRREQVEKAPEQQQALPDWANADEIQRLPKKESV